METRLVIESVPNPDVLVFHVNFALAKGSVLCIDKPLRPYDADRLAEVGRRGAVLVKRLLGIYGIKSVGLGLYEVSVEKGTEINVEKGTAFSWEDLQPKIIEILKKAIPRDCNQEFAIDYTVMPVQEDPIGFGHHLLDDDGPLDIDQLDIVQDKAPAQA